MQLSNFRRPIHLSLPPLHTWPTPLKRAIWIVACLFCALAYVMLFAGGIGLIAMLLTLEW